MKYYMKAASLLVFVFFSTQFVSGEACNISQVLVNAGEDAELFFCRSANDSSESFRLYRVNKNGATFFILPNGSAKGNCTGRLKTFCVERTQFFKYNASHLLLEIKDTLENDTGAYAVETVFKKLHSNHKEEIILHVIHLKVNVTATVPPSVRSTRDQDQTTADQQRMIHIPNKPTTVLIGHNASLVWHYYKPAHLTLFEVVFGYWKSPGYLHPKLVAVDSKGIPSVRAGYETAVSWKGNLTSSLAVFVLCNVQPVDANVDFGIQIEFGLAENPLKDVVQLRVVANAKLTATVPPSVRSTRGQDQTTGASPPTSPVTSCAFSRTSIPLIPFLLFQIMIFF